MDPRTFTIEDDPRPEDVALLNDGITRFNFAATGVDNGRWLAIFVRDASGQIEAGVHGWTWGQTGFVQTLWVRDDLRGRGLGSQLLDAAEREALRRGCVEASRTGPHDRYLGRKLTHGFHNLGRGAEDKFRSPL